MVEISQKAFLSKNTKLYLLILLGVFVLLMVILEFFPYETPIYTSLTEATLCVSKDNKYIPTTIFKIDDEIYFCGILNLHKPLKGTSQELIVYDFQIESFNKNIVLNPLFFVRREMNFGNNIFPLTAKLEEGKYKFVVSDGKLEKFSTLFSVTK
jgi:hypothetical protein